MEYPKPDIRGSTDAAGPARREHPECLLYPIERREDGHDSPVDPVAQMERLQRDIERMFSGVDTGTSAERHPVGPWFPDVDVEQATDAVVFKFDLPGLKSDQVKVSVHDRLLTVAGERHEEREEKHEGYLSRERAIGRFERSVRLPENLQQDDVEASFSDGVLTVRVPRAGESTPREVTITTP